LFTAAHLDPGHMLGVLPIGVWLGVVAWQSGSLWPSNFIFVLGSRFGDGSEKMHLDAATIAIFSVSGVAFVASIYLIWRFRSVQSSIATAAPGVTAMDRRF
jgi:hypothetical protein